MYINDTFVTQKIQGHSFGVNSVSFNPKNENQFVSCGNDSLIKKWEEKNREKRNYAKKKSSAKSFINVATKEDLEELKKLIEEKER